MEVSLGVSLFFLVCILGFIQTILVFGVLTFLLFRLRKVKGKRICILVIGDIGRSPRMTNHAISLAKHGHLVDLVGLKGVDPVKEVIDNENIRLHYLADPPSKPKGMPGILFLPFKALFQTISIFLHFMLKLEKSSHILVQNPPTIPTLAVTWLVCIIKGSHFVIDWHNYGYTILSMNLKSNTSPMVVFAKWFEGFFGSLSDSNFCVTKAMQDDLKQKWNISASVLYDRPVERYKEITVEEKHKLFVRLSSQYPELKGERPDSSEDSICEEFSSFTSQSGVSYKIRNDRPVLLISSTSWTEDEDFSILLSALEEYELCSKNDGKLPDMICIITGKGPLKQHYKDQIREKNLKHVKILTPWLSADDYPQLISSADLGVCLHTSSSGLDLPMKVVDMFSCGVPVCAIGFQCLHELISHDENGMIFSSGLQLADQLKGLLRGFPKQQDDLQKFRENLKSFQNSKWQTQWDVVAKPVFSS